MRRNLTLLVAASTSAVVLALVIPLALLVGRLAQDRAINAASQQAQSVALLIATDTPLDQLASLIVLSDERSGLHTSVVPASGSPLGPAIPTADLARARAGASFTRYQGQAPDAAAVFLPVAVQAGTSVVRVSVTPAALREGVTRARVSLIALALGLVAASLAAALVLARRVSAPLVRVAEVAHDLRSGRLQRRVVPAGPPEVEEVGRALNQLAGRIGELLQAERDAAADLSHRLRTPVTALKLAIDSTPDGEERVRLREHLDRLEETVDVVVRQGRLPRTEAAGSSAHDGAGISTELSALVSDRIDFWSALAEDQQREVRRSVQPGLRIAADPQDVVDLLDVLLDNVFAHTPSGTGFGVRVGAGAAPGVGTGAGAHRSTEPIELVVDDDGPGLPPDDQRGRGRSSAGSTGLGLDIVSRIAAATGATVSFGAGASGGARVSLRWPAMPSD